jgi:signal transduction histidine kinase
MDGAFHEKPLIIASGSAPEVSAFIADRVRWMIGIRWGALGLASFGLVVTQLMGVLPHVWVIWALVVFASMANLVFGAIWERWPNLRGEPLGTVQIILDLIVLSQVLHWGGGVDSPFGILFVLPMAAAGMLLPLRRALILGVLSVLLHGGTLLAELLGVVPHRSIDLGDHALHDSIAGAGLWQEPAYVVAYLIALAVGELGVAFFCSLLMARFRQAEARRRQHELVAQSRERLARVGGLAAGVAHTVRNPLHGLMSCVDMLQATGKEEPESAEVLDLMAEGIERIEAVTRRLLSLTSIDDPHYELTDPGILVEECQRLVRLVAHQKEVRFKSDLPRVPPLAVDADRVVEALANVLDNAVYASPRGGVVLVRMRCAPQKEKPEEWILEVADEGPGIASDHLERAFDPFFTTKPQGEGSGLGLAIARTVVEEHGGTIFLATRAPTGACVRITIPYEERGAP